MSSARRLTREGEAIGKPVRGRASAWRACGVTVGRGAVGSTTTKDSSTYSLTTSSLYFTWARPTFTTILILSLSPENFDETIRKDRLR